MEESEQFDEWYPEAKVYFDGGHYIAIPHTTNPARRRKHKQEIITVSEQDGKLQLEKTPSVLIPDDDSDFEPLEPEQVTLEEVIKEAIKSENKPVQEPVNEIKFKRATTRKQIFEELYNKYLSDNRKTRIKAIYEDMLPLFKTADACKSYVEINVDRKRKNLIRRRMRFVRKALNQEFNYFVTLTYDDKKHTEDSFKKGLKKTLANFASRRSWKYVGVWERSPKKQRLHFHGLFNIPNDTMPPMMIEVNDYNFNTHRRQITNQNTYFNDRFGRSDFETIKDKSTLGSAVAYIMKYLEKTGEKIVYSKGLPQYFISDIMDEDIICPIGLEDKKLLLYDDFRCWDEGVLMGNVSKNVIAQMRKSN